MGSVSEKGSVLVIGGGVGGIQAALDLAESGYRAYLVDSAPAIGGIMAGLDKTFPTNDCSMCILSPKLVEADQHPNIEIIAYADVEKIEGKPGDFKVTCRRKARYVDTETCTGCGACAEACVLADRIPDLFNSGLSNRSAVYVPFAQAVPRLALIDTGACLHFTKGKCKSPCVEACQQGSIDFEQKDKTDTFNVGAVVVATGSEPYDISRLTSYHPEHPNVISSMEVERIMCASGPSGGRILRPSDGKPASRIAFIQCAGSRDEKHNPYCSSVCCTYTVKEATVIKEHDPDIDCHIFHIDMRTFGKGFEQFKDRARDEYGVRFTRFKVPALEVAGPDALRIEYQKPDGSRETEEFDLAVLSVGLTATGNKALQSAGVQMDEYGFVRTDSTSPMDTSKPGIFVLGAAGGPKDIPETVAQASGAAARCGSILSGARGTDVEEKEYPPEIELDGSEPRVGVFVCSCGKNIGGVVDVPSVVEYASTLPGVVHSEGNIYTCSGESCDRIKEAIGKHDLNRVVVAACTPRTHDPLFRETIREAGLNRYLFDLANIRDQCSWVHSGEPEKATAKSKDLVRMSVARARLLQPLPSLPVSVTPSALVLGAGPAGIASALELGRAGFKTYLVDKEDRVGGNVLNVPAGAAEGELKDLTDWLESSVAELEKMEAVEVLTGARLAGLEGYIGNFKATLDVGGKARTVDAGAVIVATGGVEHKPDSYLYGSSDLVITQGDLQEKLAKGLEAKSVVMIQCVESREPDRPYCSRVCCVSALNNAVAIKDRSPDTDVFILYRDVVSYGFYEDLYRRAREAGVLFVRFDADSKPEVSESGDVINVKVKTPQLPVDLDISADLLVLSTPVVAAEDNVRIAEMLKVPVDEYGFFLEAHVKLRPVDFATAGIFLAGMCHFPKLVEEAISQGCAAAGRAATILSKESVTGEGAVAVVDDHFCRGCGVCEDVCEFSAIAVGEGESGNLVATVNQALCVGCGTCAVSCWSNAITMENFTDRQVEAMIDAVR
ncbi:MAG: FAD-dependent oxidoreductase [Actinobacteria bacterium]|nr:FAD-dependent oxidoreductase [Actinomycetota bacterium]MBU4217504.1 FAD-dependent oxidoreductase [Actinomycetota bacterium]MBU4358209.1 FAD-dependent oxidoreductase [Actinomycetota bacterium]MBU4392599.1 FAD-dependent oxidoreductase [Actinomycetota bacterium]MBU4402761.1 FAD-dependent oxidoreductase [Actinomycetota bacterium]